MKTKCAIVMVFFVGLMKLLGQTPAGPWVNNGGVPVTPPVYASVLNWSQAVLNPGQIVVSENGSGTFPQNIAGTYTYWMTNATRGFAVYTNSLQYATNVIAYFPAYAPDPWVLAPSNQVWSGFPSPAFYYYPGGSSIAGNWTEAYDNFSGTLSATNPLNGAQYAVTAGSAATAAPGGNLVTDFQPVVAFGVPNMLGQIPITQWQTGRVFQTEQPFVDNETMCPWVPMASILSKASTNQATVCVIGDSYADDNLNYNTWPRHFMQNLWAVYGNAGMEGQAEDQIGAGSVLDILYYTNFWWGTAAQCCNSNFDLVPFAQLLQYSPGAQGSGNVNYGSGQMYPPMGDNIPVNCAEMYYVEQPNGGQVTFRAVNYTSSGSANWLTYTNVQTKSSTVIVTNTILTFPTQLMDTFQCFDTNDNGTNVILAVKYWNTNQPGIIYANLGGNSAIPTAGSLDQAAMLSVGTNMITQFFSQLKPDLILYSALDYGEAGSLTPQMLYSNWTKVLKCANCPVIATLQWPYGNDSEISSALTTNNDVLHESCESNGWYCLDLASKFSTFVGNNAAGLYEPSLVHPNYGGAAALAEAASGIMHMPWTPDGEKIIDWAPGESISPMQMDIDNLGGFTGVTSNYLNGGVLRLTNYLGQWHFYVAPQ